MDGGGRATLPNNPGKFCSILLIHYLASRDLKRERCLKNSDFYQKSHTYQEERLQLNNGPSLKQLLFSSVIPFQERRGAKSHSPRKTAQEGAN